MCRPSPSANRRRFVPGVGGRRAKTRAATGKTRSTTNVLWTMDRLLGSFQRHAFVEPLPGLRLRNVTPRDSCPAPARAVALRVQQRLQREEFSRRGKRRCKHKTAAVAATRRRTTAPRAAGGATSSGSVGIANGGASGAPTTTRAVARTATSPKRSTPASCTPRAIKATSRSLCKDTFVAEQRQDRRERAHVHQRGSLRFVRASRGRLVESDRMRRRSRRDAVQDRLPATETGERRARAASTTK